MNLNNKNILVMGAAGRIGQSVVQALLANEANVIAVDQNQTISGGETEKFRYLSGNMTDALSLQAIFEQAQTYFGTIDGAVNTAYPRNKQYGRDFLDVTYADFSENVALHLGGYFLFMQHCVKYALAAQRKFALVNLSSVYGTVAPRFNLYEGTTMTMPVEYAAIKAGLQQLVKYVTAYTKQSQFRVNCVSPGGILADQNPNFVKRYSANCRIKGMLEPQDVIGAILFLLSDAAEYICGQNIIIDDGFHL